MDQIQDPSDWSQTQLKDLAPVETALRCQVCKDFYDTPMITSCSHTFCSLCIRRCLTNDGKCPACRAQDQELRLRRNWTVEELVESFKRARPALIGFDAELKSMREEAKQGRGKRKRGKMGQDAYEGVPEPLRRKTRSQSKPAGAEVRTPVEAVEDSQEEEEEAVIEQPPGMRIYTLKQAVYAHWNNRRRTHRVSNMPRPNERGRSLPTPRRPQRTLQIPTKNIHNIPVTPPNIPSSPTFHTNLPLLSPDPSPPPPAPAPSPNPRSASPNSATASSKSKPSAKSSPTSASPPPAREAS